MNQIMTREYQRPESGKAAETNGTIWESNKHIPGLLVILDYVLE